MNYELKGHELQAPSPLTSKVQRLKSKKTCPTEVQQVSKYKGLVSSN